MAEGVLAVVLLVLGALCLWGASLIRVRVLGALVERIAAVSILAAGVAGAQGWLGQAIAWLVATIGRIGGSVSESAAGGSVVWVLAGALSIAWLLALLPDSVFAWRYPRWLVFAGLLLPSLAASIPGQFGAFVRSVHDLLAGFVIELVGQAFA